MSSSWIAGIRKTGFQEAIPILARKASTSIALLPGRASTVFIQGLAVIHSYSLISGSSLRGLWKTNLMSAMLETDNTENQTIT